MSFRVGTRPGVSFVVARSAAALAALLAAAATVSAAFALPAAESAVLMAEVWRALGFATFGALFVLLAARPLLSIALWGIVLGNKIALLGIGLALGSAVPGAITAAVWDGVLVLILSTGLAAAMVARRSRAKAAAVEEKQVVFDHLGVTVRDLSLATAQFDALMQALGFTREDAEGGVSWWKDGETELILRPTREKAAEPHRHGEVGWQHLAFSVASRAEVDHLHAIALDAGWAAVRDPKLYPRYNDRYYASFVEDDSGIRIEFMHNPPRGTANA